MNKITIILKESGTIAELKKNFNIYQNSSQNVLLNILVPKSMTEGKFSAQFTNEDGQVVENGVYTAVKIGMVYIDNGGKYGKSETYFVRYLKEIKTSEGEFYVYERIMPSVFTRVAAVGTFAPKMVINVMNILNSQTESADGTISENPTVLTLITTQECSVDIEPSTNLDVEPEVDATELELLEGQVNELTAEVEKKIDGDYIVQKYNLEETIPENIHYEKNGFKTKGVRFYNETYTVPIGNTETASKDGEIYVSNVRPHETELYWILQDEVFHYDTGMAVRTLVINAVQASINQYTTMSVGEWQLVNQDYLDSIKSQTDQNSDDIEVLYRLANTGTNYLGEYPSQDTVPTDSELNQYVQKNFGRAPQNGDEFTFVLLVEDGTDVVYILLCSAVTGKWGKTALPSVEPAKNGSLGIIKGTTDEEITFARKVLVDINNGEINDILHNNESGQQESLSAQINRNSQNIAINTTDIAEIEENLSAEITRATEAEQTLMTNISAEIERAKTAEQANTTAIENEVSRATTKEGELDNDKLDKTNVNDDYLKDIVFSINGDNGVATLQLHNPVTGQTQNIEITVTTPASSTNTGLMTSDMVQALTKALEDIESLKNIGKQVASFQSYAEAELFDFSTLTDVNVNDYFIVQVDESRTEPTEKDQTTKYVCINDATPITLESFQFQSVVTTVNIQVATESKVGGVLSVNTNGYIYVESTGAMKLVGYDNLITGINNLTTAISNETTRAEGAEETLSQAITAETTRAQQAESALQTSKADKTELPTKVSELENDENYATVSQIPTDNSQLANGANYATVRQIPTDNSQLANGAGYVSASQVVRSDVAQTLTDTEKQQAQTNTTHTAWQSHANSGVQPGWYQVANLTTQGNYDIKIKQGYNYNFPEAIHLSISINNRLYTGEPFASITQLSGVKPASFALAKIRVRQGTDEDATFLDVYNPDQLWNTTWVDITSDSQDVVVEPNSPFQFIGTEDNPSGYKISSLDLVNGFNTSNEIYRNGQPLAQLPKEYAVQVNTGNASEYIHIGSFPIYDTNITVDVSCTSASIITGRVVFSCTNNAVNTAYVYGDPYRELSSKLFYSLQNNTIDLYFQAPTYQKLMYKVWYDTAGDAEPTVDGARLSTLPATATNTIPNALDRTSQLRVGGTVATLGVVSNLNTISQPVNSTVTYTFGGGCANAPITDSGMVVQMQESTAFCTQLVIANDEKASTWRRSYRDGTWTEWEKLTKLKSKTFTSAVDIYNFMQDNIDSVSEVVITTSANITGDLANLRITSSATKFTNNSTAILLQANYDYRFNQFYKDDIGVRLKGINIYYNKGENNIIFTLDASGAIRIDTNSVTLTDTEYSVNQALTQGQQYDTLTFKVYYFD